MCLNTDEKKTNPNPCLCVDHWDYHPQPHIHPAEFENLQETNFTELQSVQTLHPPGLLRPDTIRYDAENLLDPGTHAHVLQQPVSSDVKALRVRTDKLLRPCPNAD